MTTTVDSKKRIVLPTAKPGDLFDVQRQDEGHFILVRLACPEPKARLTQAQCLLAIAAAPLHPKMDWETLSQPPPINLMERRRATTRAPCVLSSEHHRSRSRNRDSLHR